MMQTQVNLQLFVMCTLL